MVDLIRGSFSETTIDNLKLGAKKPPMPFSACAVVECSVSYFLVFTQCRLLPCHEQPFEAKAKQFYHDYQVIVAAGSRSRHRRGSLAPGI